MKKPSHWWTVTPVCPGGGCPPGARACRSRSEGGRAPAGASGGEPGPLWHPRRSASGPHDSVLHRWSPKKTTPSPEDPESGQSGTSWCVWWFLDMRAPSSTLDSLSLRACLAAFSASPPAVSQACLASALESCTTPRTSEKSVSSPPSPGGFSQAWSLEDKGQVHERHSRRAASNLSYGRIPTETDWKEDVATDILIWSSTRGSSIFSHLEDKTPLSPATFTLV